MEQSYLDDIWSKVTEQLEEAQEKDNRMRFLYKKFQKAQKSSDIKEKAKLTCEIQKRQQELAEELIQKQITEDCKKRAFERYMSGEDAEKYDLLRDAIVITYDALETLFMDMADIVYRNTEFVKMEYPKCFKDCVETIRRYNKEEKEVMNDKQQNVLADVSDNLVEMIINKTKNYRTKTK